jgi:hypothetical protein
VAFERPCTAHGLFLTSHKLPPCTRQADSLHFFPLPRWYPLTLPGDHEEVYEDGAGAVKSGELAPALLMCVQLVAMDEMVPVPVSLLSWHSFPSGLLVVFEKPFLIEVHLRLHFRN